VEEFDLIVDRLVESVLKLHIELEDALEPSIVIGVNAILVPLLVVTEISEDEVDEAILLHQSFIFYLR
jgi:hypothetical protein